MLRNYIFIRIKIDINNFENKKSIYIFLIIGRKIVINSSLIILILLKRILCILYATCRILRYHVYLQCYFKRENVNCRTLL